VDVARRKEIRENLDTVAENQKQGIRTLKERLVFEELISQISAKFVNLPVDQIDSSIDDTMRLVCECLELDLSSLWLRSVDDPSQLILTHLYRPLGGPPLPNPMNAHEHFPWSQGKLETGEIVAISSMDDLPAGAARDQETWRHFGVKTALVYPLSTGGAPTIGALSFNTMQQERIWPETLVKRLQLVSQIFINALDRKQKETDLRESEARLSLTIDAVGAGLWIIYVTTNKVWISPKSRELFHFAPDEDIDYAKYFEVIHPEDRDLVDQTIQQAIRTGTHLRCDYRIVLPDGSIRWITSRIQYSMKSDSGPERIMGLTVDITERKQLELEIKKSQTLLAALINSTSDMIWSVDPERFGLLTFNSGLYDYFLRHHNMRIGTGLRPEDLFSDNEYIQKWHSFYRRALDERSFTTEYQTHSGNRTLRLNFNVLKSDEGTFGISVFGQDVTELKVLEKQLRRQLMEIQELKSKLEQENTYLRNEIKTEKGFDKIIGSSDTLQYVLFRARQVALTDATVLILGETGTGKGMVANAIHEMSTRKGKPMIMVNCAALPANLIESELFGREKGAFTGAYATQAGRFEVADGGTIFLDEIGELPLDLQSKLLRVLQDGEFERLGSPRTIKVNVRVIASTSRDLKAEMRAGRFREDLYYRLNVFPVSLPPLRMRVEDIPVLAWHFINRYARKIGKQFESVSNETMESLQAYNWPGNVRELEHVIERAVITSPEPELRLLEQLEFESNKCQETAVEAFNAVAREHILQVLQKTGWKIEGEKGAAAILGLNPSTLRFRIKKLGIKRP